MQVGTQSGLFDGLEVHEGALLATDITGPLLRVDLDTGAAVELTNLVDAELGAANDFGIDAEAGRLLVADLGTSAVWFVDLD